MANDEKWISKQTAARRLDVPTSTIDRLRAARELASIHRRQPGADRDRLASWPTSGAEQNGLKEQPEPTRDRLTIPDSPQVVREWLNRRSRSPAIASTAAQIDWDNIVFTNNGEGPKPFCRYEQ